MVDVTLIVEDFAELKIKIRFGEGAICTKRKIRSNLPGINLMLVNGFEPIAKQVY